MFNNANLFAQALGIEKPWKLDEVKFHREEGQLDIHISHVTGSLLPCPDCQQESSIHDTRERTWRHLNFFQHRAYIHCNVPRVMCGKCGSIKQVEIPWARPGSGFTVLFEAFIMELAAHMPVKPIGELVGEHDTRSKLHFVPQRYRVCATKRVYCIVGGNPTEKDLANHS